MVEEIHRKLLKACGKCIPFTRKTNTIQYNTIQNNTITKEKKERKKKIL